MKTIKNEKVTIELQTANGVVSQQSNYIALIKQCVLYVSDNGIVYEEMKRRDRIFAKVQDETVANIKLEDSDHSHLITLVKNMPWAIFSQPIKEFCDYITNL